MKAILALSAIVWGWCNLVQAQQGAVIELQVYKFEGQAERIQAFLKTMLPYAASGVNANGRFGVLTKQRATRIGAELENWDLLADEAFTMLSGLSEPIELMRQDKGGHETRVGRLDVIPTRLGNGDWRFEMRVEMNDEPEPLEGRNDQIDNKRTPPRHWVDVATNLVRDQAMVTTIQRSSQDSGVGKMNVRSFMCVAILKAEYKAPLPQFVELNRPGGSTLRLEFPSGQAARSHRVVLRAN